MKNIIAFLFGWIIAAVLLIPQAHAAVAVTPAIAGYSAATGRYASSAAGFAMTAANDGYIAQSVINVGGRAVTIPATLRVASNAGQIALSGMRLTPLGIVGTLAAGWLLSEGLEYLNDQWMKSVPSSAGATTCTGSDQYGQVLGDQTTVQSILSNRLTAAYGSGHWDYGWNSSSPSSTASGKWIRDANGGFYGSFDCSGQPAPDTKRPATDDDFHGLTDPLPAVAPELPYAPYMPQGVPVNKPEFVPADLPVGNPYTRPDGSTAQPRVKVSPSGDGQVTIAPYDQPLTDPQGQPVPNAQPEPTPDPQQSECEKHPNTIGCSEYGTTPAPDAIQTKVIPVDTAVVPIGGSGTCPADVTTSHFGITWSYKPVCDFADAIRPLVIGFAWLAFAYIVAGTIRT